MSRALPFTGVSQAACLMDHLTNLLWAGAERKEKARVARGKSMAFRGVLFRLHFHLITLHLL